MEQTGYLENIKKEKSDACDWNEEISVKEENIELEIDPLSLCDEGIETDYESEEKFPCIDYSNWYKSSVADLSRGLCLPLEHDKNEFFFNYNPLGDFVHPSFVCFYCGELWNDKNGLKYHIKNIHMAKKSIKAANDNGFECFYCRRKFKNIRRLLAHTTRKHKQKYIKNKRRGKNKKVKVEIGKKKPFACQFCEYRAEHRCLVNNHIKRVHEKIKPYQCPHCDFRSAYNHAVRYHIESKHIMSEHFSSKKVKSSVYDICGDRFMQSLNRRFQVMLKQNDLKPYACTKCNYRATRANILQNHIKVKHENISYYCPYCDFKTIIEKNLTIHLSVKHQISEPYTCPHCDFVTDSSQDIKDHKKEHTKEKLYSCFLCTVRCSRPADLRRHVRAFHEKRKQYSCPHCSFDCFKISEMKSHTALVHGTVSTLYSCAHCDFVSYNLEELKSHATSEHGKVELFSCLYCEFRCVQKDKLDIHISLQHKDI